MLHRNPMNSIHWIFCNNSVIDNTANIQSNTEALNNNVITDLR
jgi:hypothetical protein